MTGKPKIKLKKIIVEDESYTGKGSESDLSDNHDSKKEIENEEVSAKEPVKEMPNTIFSRNNIFNLLLIIAFLLFLISATLVSVKVRSLSDFGPFGYSTIDQLIIFIFLTFCFIYIANTLRVKVGSNVHLQIGRLAEKVNDSGRNLENVDLFTHGLGTFLLPFGLGFLGSIESLFTTFNKLKDSVGNGSHDLKFDGLTIEPEAIWALASYAFAEALLVTLITIQITTLYFLTRLNTGKKTNHGSNLVVLRSIITSLIISVSIDIVVLVIVKTIVSQPGIEVRSVAEAAYYTHLGTILFCTGIFAFYSSFTSIHMAEIYIDVRLSENFEDALNTLPDAQIRITR